MAGEVQYIFFIMTLKGYIERGILTLNKTELDVALRYITNVFTLPPSFHSAAGHTLTREARDSSYTREFRVLKALEEESLVVHMRMVAECV